MNVCVCICIWDNNVDNKCAGSIVNNINDNDNEVVVKNNSINIYNK